VRAEGDRDARPARRPGIAALALAWFVVSTLLLVSPIFFWLGNTIEPRVLGLPFSLAYVLGVVAINSVVLAVLYVTRVIDDEGEGDA
jgi:hypothetical protein